MWVLMHAVAVNPGGVNEPIAIAVLERRDERWGARRLPKDELQEHRENVAAAKEHLRLYPEEHKREDAAEIPEPPAESEPS